MIVTSERQPVVRIILTEHGDLLVPNPRHSTIYMDDPLYQDIGVHGEFCKGALTLRQITSQSAVIACNGGCNLRTHPMPLLRTYRELDERMRNQFPDRYHFDG